MDELLDDDDRYTLENSFTFDLRGPGGQGEGLRQRRSLS